MGSSNYLGSCWFSLFPAGLLPVPRLPQNHAYTIHAHSSPEGHHLGSGQQEPRQVFTLDRPGLSFFVPKYPDHSNKPTQPPYPRSGNRHSPKRQTRFTFISRAHNQPPNPIIPV